MSQRSLSRRLRGTLAAVALAALAAASPAAANDRHLVVFHGAIPDRAAAEVQRAGGTVVAAYDEIGVLVAASADPRFSERMRRVKGVEGAAPTAGMASAVQEPGAAGLRPGELPNAPAGDADTFSGLQWDMRQIRAPQAHAVTGGSPAVTVGDIDTGVDKDHPDLAAAIDHAKSVSCESGAPDPSPAAWDDRHGHGTHTSGTIAARSNGIGVVGVAPNVRLAAIKASTDEGFFFPEMVVCAFVHAGRSGLDVTSNSYYADPWRYNCRNDAAQRAIWKAEQRAVRFAQQRGVLVVASAGNESEDTSHPTTDDTSPDFPPGSEQEREVTNACLIVPTELPGVVGVSAVGSARDEDGSYLKSFYSNWGVSTVDITAPGGDSRAPTPEAPNGRVLSTWPAEIGGSLRLEDCTAGPCSTYRYAQGTSMAAPHVAGVAALIESRYGPVTPTRIEALLQQTASRQTCPDEVCQGTAGHTSYYGAGQVDALAAVSR